MMIRVANLILSGNHFEPQNILAGNLQALEKTTRSSLVIGARLKNRVDSERDSTYRNILAVISVVVHPAVVQFSLNTAQT